jgi:hypothetical protein
VSLLSWFRHKRDRFHCGSPTCDTCEPFYVSGLKWYLEVEAVEAAEKELWPMPTITEQI